MSVVPENTLGGHVRAGTMRAAHAETLARALFNGSRPLPINGKEVVSPSFDSLTKHEQTILKGIFLKAKVKVVVL